MKVRIERTVEIPDEKVPALIQWAKDLGLNYDGDHGPRTLIKRLLEAKMMNVLYYEE